jgi:hypothetical protein
MDERYLHAHFDTPHFSYCELDFLDHQGFTMDAPSYISFWKRSSAIYPTWTALPAWIFFFFCLPLPGAISLFLIDHSNGF